MDCSRPVIRTGLYPACRSILMLNLRFFLHCWWYNCHEHGCSIHAELRSCQIKLRKKEKLKKILLEYKKLYFQIKTAQNRKKLNAKSCVSSFVFEFAHRKSRNIWTLKGVKYKNESLVNMIEFDFDLPMCFGVIWVWNGFQKWI